MFRLIVERTSSTILRMWDCFNVIISRHLWIRAIINVRELPIWSLSRSCASLGFRLHLYRGHRVVLGDIYRWIALVTLLVLAAINVVLELFVKFYKLLLVFHVQKLVALCHLSVKRVTPAWYKGMINRVYLCLCSDLTTFERVLLQVFLMVLIFAKLLLFRLDFWIFNVRDDWYPVWVVFGFFRVGWSNVWDVLVYLVCGFLVGVGAHVDHQE